MSTEADIKRVTHKLDAVAKVLAPGAALKAALGKAGRVGKADALGHARMATKGSGRLSHMGRSGVRLGVGYDFTGPAEMTYKLRPKGVWMLVDEGARGHDERPRRRGGKKAMTIRGGDGSGFAVRVHHPGTHGKHVVTAVKTGLNRVVPPAFGRALFEEMGRAWH